MVKFVRIDLCSFSLIFHCLVYFNTEVLVICSFLSWSSSTTWNPVSSGAGRSLVYNKQRMSSKKLPQGIPTFISFKSKYSSSCLIPSNLSNIRRQYEYFYQADSFFFQRKFYDSNNSMNYGFNVECYHRNVNYKSGMPYF